MANIQPRFNKDGQLISYSIRVYKGRDIFTGKQLKPYTMTWKVPDGLREKTAEKEAQKQATLFEQKCKDGIIMDSHQTFSQYAEYVLKTKVLAKILKPRTEYHYRELLLRINDAIGHMKLGDIRPLHLNQFYEQLSKHGTKHGTEKAIAKVDLKMLLKDKCLSQADISRNENIHVHYNTILRACNGKTISAKSAEDISEVLNLSPSKIFRFFSDESPLASQTIRDHHQFISTILRDAEKEMLIPYNPASKARPPKIARNTPNYLQIEDITKIINALANVPIKWRTMIHLFLATGCRLSEVIGLKWGKVNWENGQILIDNTLQYTPNTGLYEDTPKTKNSIRYINLPDEMMLLLKEYHLWQAEQNQLPGNSLPNNDFVFTNSKGNGLNPGTVAGWLRNFSKQHDLPYLNAHAFRHTQASILFFHGIDAVSISRRLGHAKVSTTTDIYSHIIKESESKISKCVADVIYKTQHKENSPEDSAADDSATESSTDNPATEGL